MLSPEKEQMLVNYNEGMRLYKERKWTEAKEFFAKALEFEPTDGPSKLYVYRCEQYETTPPPDDWNGVFIMTTK